MAYDGDAHATVTVNKVWLVLTSLVHPIAATLKDTAGAPMIQLAARAVRMAWHVIARIVPEPLLKAWFCYFLA